MLYLQFWSKAADEWSQKTLAGGVDTLDEFSKADSCLLEKAAYILDDFFPQISDVSANLPNNSQAKYGYLTDYGTQILCIFTPFSGCKYLSPNFEKLTGLSASAQYGDEFFFLLHPDFEGRLRAALMPEQLAHSPQVLRCKLRHDDEKYYWYQFTIHVENNGSLQYVCIIENIHENMQAQNTLHKARLEAELAFRSRSEFLANMSHELRTPLNAVIGFSQIMASGIFGKIENEHYQNYIDLIHDSGQDLLGKIEDLLEIANIDAGRVSLSRSEVFVADLVHDALQTQARIAQAAGVKLKYVPRGNVLLFVDRVKLKHIIGHLLSNAIKFSKSGGEVRVEIARAENNGIQIMVRDNGVGIDEPKCRDIREALQQESCWTAKNSQYIGIGLALTKEFVHLHGGTVEITSSAKQGTAIAIILPRAAIRVAPARKYDSEKTLEIA